MADDEPAACVQVQTTEQASAILRLTQIAKRAQHVFLEKLKSAQTPSASAFLNMRVRQCVLQNTRGLFDDVNKTKNPGAGGSSSALAVLKAVVPFVTRCLPHVTDLSHVCGLSAQMFDVATQVPDMEKLVFGTYFGALLKQCYANLEDSTGAAAIKESPSGGAGDGSADGSGVVERRRDFLQARFLTLRGGNVATTKALSWLQLAIFTHHGHEEIDTKEDLAITRRLILEFPLEDPNTMRCLRDIVEGLRDFPRWKLLAAFLAQELRRRKNSSHTRAVLGVVASTFSRFAWLAANNKGGQHQVQHDMSSSIAADTATQQDAHTEACNNLLRVVAQLYDKGVSDVEFRELEADFHGCFKAAGYAVGPQMLLEILPLRLLEADMTAKNYARTSRGFLLTVLENFDPSSGAGAAALHDDDDEDEDIADEAREKKVARPAVQVSLHFFRSKLLPLAD
ncbi:unnamed protein product, partial [Amoebophrya sp. A25]|eukprot:GSA25T00017605001.1